MYLLPREQDKLQLHLTGSLAQKRLARGVKLNLTETIALISSVLQELIRDGKHTVAELMALGKTLLGRRQVLPTVPSQLHDIQVEGTFPDGTFLVTVHEPISRIDGNLELALYGSFLPVPTLDNFGPPDDVKEEVPGQLIVCKTRGNIKLNEGRERTRLRVTNNGDRPVQVGSHYHFSETNKQLSFDRGLALGKRLDIAAGTAVRFEPGEAKTVTLVSIGGTQRVSGGNGLFEAAFGKYPNKFSSLRDHDISSLRDVFVQKVLELGFSHKSQQELVASSDIVGFEMSRQAYSAIYGPTTGDRIRLGDSPLWIQVEKDLTTYGDECKFGGGKTLREGMGQATGRADEDTLDLVILNALIIDWSGIYKADIGIKNGFIKAIGKSGNPDIMDGVTEGMIVGANTETIEAANSIVTAGAQDAHVHYICPQLWQEALASGITTLVGGGTGPSAGTSATTCTPGKTNIHMMLSALDEVPLNTVVTGKGNDSGRQGLVDQVAAGVAGLKLHEDWGTTPSAIDTCLSIADEFDIQTNIHTDTLNESSFCEETMKAIDGRTIQFYHVEGAGGGHAPDIITACEYPNVLPSSTNPTRPYCTNTLDEHLDMLMVCHHLDRRIPEDIAFAESRIRGETVAAEDVLHDTGAISMISSDSQAMGRIGEVVSRTWRTASKMKTFRGPLVDLGDTEENDNMRVKRYVSKYTINVAITHGISHIVGDVVPGKLADLVIWKPANFGVRPEQVIKGGFIAWAQMGDANASIPTVQPVVSRPMWGSSPRVAALNSFSFVSKISIDNGAIASYKLNKRTEAVKNCRNIGKKDMKWNDQMPKLTVDPETYRVEADGVHCTVEPAQTLPLTQSYLLF